MAKMLKRSPHYGQHVAHGAKGFMDFAGWEMPESFSSPEEEARACRESAVIFDGHQMGEIHVTGKDAHAAVQKLCSSNIKPVPGRCFYSGVLNERGGFVDDLVVLCLEPDHYLLTAAAFNVHKTPGWLRSHVGDMDVEIDDQTPGTTIIEIQGPKSREILQSITEADLSNEALPYFRCVQTKVAGIDCIVARLGVTGEVGYEIIYDPGYAWTMYDALVKAGEEHGAVLCGNKIVGLFRLEKVYHIYTREIDEDTNPFEAGLDGPINLDAGEFIGRDALLRIKEKGVGRKLVGYEVDSGPVVITAGTPIEIMGKEVGRATFGANSPTLNKVIGLGYVPADLAAVGTELHIVTDSGKLPAKIVQTPFFDPEGKRIRM